MSPAEDMRKPVRTALAVCPVEVAVAVLGGTWKLTIIKGLLDHGTLRFSELGRQIPAVSTRTLARQLRELEHDGVVARTVYAEVPPKVEYALTDLDQSLAPVVEHLNAWGAIYAGRVGG